MAQVLEGPFTDGRAPSPGADAGGVKESLSSVELRLHPGPNKCTDVSQRAEKEGPLGAWREELVHGMGV